MPDKTPVFDAETGVFCWEAIGEEGVMVRCIQLSIVSAAAVIIACILPVQAQAGWSHDPAVNTAITSQAGADTNPAILDDGAGGAIIAWMGPENNIYAQRIDTNGNVKWGANSVKVSSRGDMFYPQLASDGAGGVFITWQGGSDGSGNIYATRLDGNGNALWKPTDVPAEVIVCSNFENEPSFKKQFPRIVSDGSNGAIITWQDNRNGEDDYDIYAQRVHSDGDGDYEELWIGNGQEICIADGNQYYPQLIGDGSGGAIITWQDIRSGKWKIMALKVDGEFGTPTSGWPFDGNPVSFSDQDHVKPQIISAGSDGAIITWQVGSDGSGGIYAQKISGIGENPWFVNQLELIVSTGQINRQNPQIISDGTGGAVIAWLGINSSNGSSTGIFAQRLDANGAAKWSTNGVTVATPVNIDTADPPQIVSDGSHGAVITWADQRNGTDRNIYAQKVDGTDGHALWGVNGAQVSNAANHQQSPMLIGDGSGGAIITWRDVRNGDGDIYAQKLLAAGTLPVVAPTVTTAAATAIAFTSASSGGNVIADSGSAVTARGVCWGTSANPEVGGSCISAGSGVGTFSGVISGLIPATLYHVRAYATNSTGTSYGDDLQFTTRDVFSALTLSLSLNGGGVGRITSEPAGIDCTTAQCPPVRFATDTNVTLTAIPDSDSRYTWGGDCTVTNGKCTVTMSGGKSATATFTYVQTARILGSVAPYSHIGVAYAGLPAGGGTIQARVHEFTENLNFNRSMPSIIKGGYDTAYNGNSALTTVKGTVTVTRGTLTVENLVIR